MKNQIVILLLVALSININAQRIGKAVWQQKYAWEEGLTNAISLQTYKKNRKGDFSETSLNNKNFIITANSNNGIIKVFKIDNQTGAIKKKVTQKKGFKTGKWALTTFKYSGNNKYYLFISHSDYGEAEVYKINKRGKIKKRTWYTEKFEKDISIALSTNNNLLFLMKPDAGWAWMFKENPDGTLGEATWHANNWERGMTAATHFDNNKIFTLKPNGRAWAFMLDNNKLLDLWSTKKFNQGVSTLAANTTNYKQVIIGAPSKGEEWILEFGHRKNKSKFGKFVSKIFKSVEYKDKFPNMDIKWKDTNWEKGASIQTIINGGKHIFVAKPEIGAAWIYELIE